MLEECAVLPKSLFFTKISTIAKSHMNFIDAKPSPEPMGKACLLQVLSSCIAIDYYTAILLSLLFRMHKGSSIWSPKRRVAYVHEGEPSELGSL
jgi:hypothetical protein